MVEKRFTMLDRLKNPMIDMCLEQGTLALIGIFWKKKYVMWIDHMGTVVIQYE